MYSLFIFLIVLVALVMIHEFGHFIAAKICKMRVEEFAFGFPPKLFSKKIGETEYKINLLPIGGYVKITGESFDEKEREQNKNDKKAFQNKSWYAQLFVLSAGIIMNLFLAAALFFFVGLGERHISADDKDHGHYVTNPSVIVSSVISGSPSETAGIDSGDIIQSMSSGKSMATLKSAEDVVNFVKDHNEDDIKITFKKENGEVVTSTVRAVYGISEDKKSIGLSVAYGEKLKLSAADTFVKSIRDTYEYTKLTIEGYANLVKRLVVGESVMDSLSGPVGIAKMVGGASKAGIDTLLIFVALLSVNLAVFNALPFPALDGGRIIFVIYETITRRKININFQYYANFVGFMLLMGLMLTVTFFDLFK